MKPELFFIHGMWSTADCWTPFADWFAEQGYTCHRSTLRHHDVGPDDPVPPELGGLSLLDYLDDLEKEISELDSMPVVFGHSMGGALAQLLAARGRVRAAVLLCPAPLAGWPALLELASPSVFYTLAPSMFLRALWDKPTRLSWKRARFSTLNCLPEDEARENYATWISESGRVLFELGFWFFDRRRASRVRREDIRQPVFTAWGASDRVVAPASTRATARAIAHNNPLNTSREIPRHGHWLIRESGWQELAADIDTWISALDEG